MVERFLDAFDRERQEAVPQGRSFADLEKRFYKALGGTGDPQVFFQGVQQFRQMKQDKIVNYVKSAYALDAAGNREGAAQQLQAAGMLLYPNIRSQVNVGPQNSYVVRNYDAETGEMTGGYALNSNQFMELALALEDSEAFLRYGLDQERIAMGWRETKARERALNAEVDERRMRTQYLAAQKATEEALLQPRVDAQNALTAEREQRTRLLEQQTAAAEAQAELAREQAQTEAATRDYTVARERMQTAGEALEFRGQLREDQQAEREAQDNARNFGLRVAQRAVDEHFARVQPAVDRVTDESGPKLGGEALETFATGIDVSLRGLGNLNRQTLTLEPDAAMMVYFESWANSMRLADPSITEDQALTAIMATLQPEARVGFIPLRDGRQALQVGTSTTPYPLAGFGQNDAREALDIVRTTLARQMGYEEPEVFRVTAAERPREIAHYAEGVSDPLSPRAQAQAVEYLPITEGVYEQRLADKKRREEAIDIEGRRAGAMQEASEQRLLAEQREDQRQQRRDDREAEARARAAAFAERANRLREADRNWDERAPALEGQNRAPLDRVTEEIGGIVETGRRTVRGWREENAALRQGRAARRDMDRISDAEIAANQRDTLPPDLQSELRQIAEAGGRAKGQRIRDLAERYPQYRDAISRWLQEQRNRR